MRRETRDEILRSFLAFNTALREEVRDIRRLLAARQAEAKYNPNWRLQPRAPRGTAEGGQWVDGKVGAPKQARPAPVQQRAPPSPPSSTARLVVPQREQPDGFSLPLAFLRAAPLLLATPLYGDTPRPIITTYAVPGTDDLVLQVIHDRQSNQRFASFHRIVQPERRVPFAVFGLDTGLETTEPAQLSPLNVRTQLDDDDIIFDPVDLALAYGREIPSIPIAGGPNAPDRPQFRGVAHTWEETDMILAMRLQGRPWHEIETALQAVRRSRAEFRNSAGIAFSSRPLPRIRGTWISPDTIETTVPEEIAIQLEGRTFRNFDDFRRAFWIAVAVSPFARDFDDRDIARMRLGYPPVVGRPSERYGRLRTYIIHHKKTIARGGATYDMSNMLIVTPSRHQDILPPSEHFGPPRRRSDP